MRGSGGDRRSRFRCGCRSRKIWLWGCCRGDLRLLRSFYCLRREEIIRGLVHLTAPCDKPFDIQIGEVGRHGEYEIKAWLVASGNDMGNAGAGYAYYVCELGLAEIFGRQELL